MIQISQGIAVDGEKLSEIGGSKVLITQDSSPTVGYSTRVRRRRETKGRLPGPCLLICNRFLFLLNITAHSLIDIFIHLFIQETYTVLALGF